MNSQRTIIPALFLSLILHGVAFAVAHHVQNREVALFTQTEVTPDPADRPNEEEPADEPEVTLGIEESDYATVTWIGYDEYEQHIAKLARIEQAEMSLDEAVPSPPVQPDKPIPPEQTAQPPIEPIESLADAALPPPLDEPGTPLPPQSNDQAITPPAPSLVSTSTEVESTPDSHPPVDLITDRETAQSIFTPSLFFSSPFFQPPSPSEQQPEPDKTPPPPPPDKTDTPQEDQQPSETQPAPPSAKASDKDSAPTSIKPIPDIPWNSGKPLASEGIEVHPYALYRHIIVDSNDRLFLLHWNERVTHNPIASIRFNRLGKARQVNILKYSGYSPLDKNYLVSWLSRWTASGKAIDELGPNELTEPFLFKIVFINEKADRP